MESDSGRVCYDRTLNGEPSVLGSGSGLVYQINTQLQLSQWMEQEGWIGFYYPLEWFLQIQQWVRSVNRNRLLPYPLLLIDSYKWYNQQTGTHPGCHIQLFQILRHFIKELLQYFLIHNQTDRHFDKYRHLLWTPHAWFIGETAMHHSSKLFLGNPATYARNWLFVVHKTK